MVKSEMEGNSSMEYGMPTLIELDSLEETARLCKELELSFIELNMNLPQYQISELEDVNQYLRLQKQYGIFFTIHLDENLNIADFNELVANAYSQTVRRTIRVGKILGVPILNMHMNPGVHFTLPDRKVQLFEQYEDKYLAAISEFRIMCEDEVGENGLKISIENTDGFSGYEQKAIDLLLESKVFSLTWDIGHSNSAGNVDENFLMERQSRLAHFHIHDSVGERNHLTLGTGEIDLPQRINIASANHCRCVVETKTIQSLRQSICWLISRPKVE